MVSIVGKTGFVGSNICAMAGDEIEAAYHSADIEDAYGTHPDVLIYAGLRAEKYLANTAPERDMELICQAERNIEKIAPRRLVLISTVDVFKIPREVDETSEIITEDLHPYGYNRYQLELWVRQRYPDALIIRLPGLFGRNIKKNFIYDLIHVIPSMLKEEKFRELSAKDPDLETFYTLQDNGFYKVHAAEAEEGLLREKFEKLGFTALHFTDSRCRYQFYPLTHLWQDLNRALDAGIRLWHPATEPVSAGELYEYLTGKKFLNELAGNPVDYDYRTIHAELFGGRDGYLLDKQHVMEEIREFVEAERNRYPSVRI